MEEVYISIMTTNSKGRLTNGATILLPFHKLIDSVEPHKTAVSEAGEQPGADGRYELYYTSVCAVSRAGASASPSSPTLLLWLPGSTFAFVSKPFSSPSSSNSIPQ